MLHWAMAVCLLFRQALKAEDIFICRLRAIRFIPQLAPETEINCLGLVRTLERLEQS